MMQVAEKWDLLEPFPLQGAAVPGERGGEAAVKGRPGSHEPGADAKGRGT